MCLIYYGKEILPIKSVYISLQRSCKSFKIMQKSTGNHTVTLCDLKF